MLRTTSQGARAPMDACIRRRAGHTTTSQGRTGAVDSCTGILRERRSEHLDTVVPAHASVHAIAAPVLGRSGCRIPSARARVVLNACLWPVWTTRSETCAAGDKSVISRSSMRGSMGHDETLWTSV